MTKDFCVSKRVFTCLAVVCSVLLDVPKVDETVGVTSRDDVHTLVVKNKWLLAIDVVHVFGFRFFHVNVALKWMLKVNVLTCESVLACLCSLLLLLNAVVEEACEAPLTILLLKNDWALVVSRTNVARFVYEAA